MLKTPSVMSSLRWPAGRSLMILRAASTSLCGNTLIVARLRRQPSMMLAWFSSSEMTTSSLVRIAETVPAFAAKPLWKTTTALDLLELGEPPLELHVDLHRAGDGADRPDADAEVLDRLRAPPARSRGCVVRPR